MFNAASRQKSEILLALDIWGNRSWASDELELLWLNEVLCFITIHLYFYMSVISYLNYMVNIGPYSNYEDLVIDVFFVGLYNISCHLYIVASFVILYNNN